jgi:putative transposase
MIDDTEYIVRKEMDTVIEIENLSYKKTETWGRWDLLNLWEQDKLIFKVVKGNEFEVELIDYELIPKDYRLDAERKLEILKPVLKGDVLSSEIKKYISSLPKDMKISVATLYNWKKKYEKSHDIRSLISRHDLKGPKERWSNEIAKSKVVGVVEEYLYEGEHFTLDYLYNEYILRMDELNEFRDERIKPVSETTFWRIKNDIKDLERLEEIKYGKVLARLNKNGAQSKVVVHRPLERVEIDWTPVDILLVDPKSLKPKKPWLVYAIDKYSDHPLGFFVTFDPINANAVKQCLLHCLMPKTYIKDLYPLVENEWTAFGKPELLVFDNSKVNDSLDVLDACQQLGIESMFCPVDSGYLKASIERHFGILNTKVFHSLKGTTFSNVFERGRYDSEGKAYLTMQSFIYICHLAMVDMIAFDINVSKRVTRRDLWIRGLQENPEINLTVSRTKTELKMILMSGIVYRRLSNKGVVIQNEHYTSPELMKLRHQLLTDGEEMKKLRVRYDLADIRSIYVYNEYEKRYIEAFNKNLQEKGFQIELPVHFSDLELDSKLIAEAKNSRDRRLFGRANRKIRIIQGKDKKKFIRYKNMNNKEIERLREENEELPVYHGISTEGISHVQLGTPEAADTIQLIKEEHQEVNEKQQRKKSNTWKNRQGKKTATETNDSSYISSSFEIDIDDLPDWNTKIKGSGKHDYN